MMASSLAAVPSSLRSTRAVRSRAAGAAAFTGGVGGTGGAWCGRCHRGNGLDIQNAFHFPLGRDADSAAHPRGIRPVHVTHHLLDVTANLLRQFAKRFLRHVPFLVAVLDVNFGRLIALPINLHRQVLRKIGLRFLEELVVELEIELGGDDCRLGEQDAKAVLACFALQLLEGLFELLDFAG